jgi:CxxC motif-containing protein (DUF1111 family)
MRTDGMRHRRRWTVLGLLALSTATCARPPDAPVGEPGDPLPGLDPEQLARFEAGRALFNTDIPPEQGLGPAFNQRRCSSCHDLPSLGGSGVEQVIRATRFADGRCDALRDEGGDNVQPRVTELFRSMGGVGERIPPSATHTVDMVAPALYGLGLVAAIPDSVILAKEDPDDADGDGISGRAGRTADGTLARFGQKGSHATIRSFIEGALLEEMGLTTPAYPEELRVGSTPAPAGADPAPDPEFDEARISLLIDFVRYLAPPAPEAPGGDDARRIEEGRRRFTEIGCAGCHTPQLVTRTDAPAPLAGKTLRLYSDLLLHDLGADWAGICSPSASPTEVRTAPLMGLRHRPLLTSDGRAGTVEDAVERHGGEAAAAAAAFARLSPDRRDALLRFLLSL